MNRFYPAVLCVSVLAGCATTGSSGTPFGSVAQGISNQASEALARPKIVDDYTKFADREDIALSAVINAQKLAGYKPAGKLQTVTFQKPTVLGLRSFKVEFASEAGIQVPTDALANRSPSLVAMLKAFGGYVVSRPEPSQIFVAAGTQKDVDFLVSTIKSAHPALLVTPIVKENIANAFISFVSKGVPGIRKVS